MINFFEGAKLSVRNNEDDTPLDLIFDFVQNAGEFIEKLFDKNVVKKSGNDTNAWLKSINFKYTILNPRSGGSKGEVKVRLKRKHLARAMLLLFELCTVSEGTRLTSPPPP